MSGSGEVAASRQRMNGEVHMFAAFSFNFYGSYGNRRAKYSVLQ